MSTEARGGCLCGDIRYRIVRPPLVSDLCHCRSCRLAAGAPAVAWIVVRRRDLIIDRGAPVMFPSSPGVERTFCGRCGTSLTYHRDDRPAARPEDDTIDIHTATLDDPDAFPPTREIWLEDKVAWMATNERLPHYPRSSKEPAPASETE